LTTYRRKRRFQWTPEPRGKRQRSSKRLHFVVQKHQASHLHYDFRLELDGVLKSWAVPKGPSLNPKVKRLAVMVEDHPLDYRIFEGTIPEGNYGAGTVMIWDEGTYETAGAESRAASEEAVREGLERGRLHITLHGHKLRGEFTLIKLQRGKPNEWLLSKNRDSFATESDGNEEDLPVKGRPTRAGVARRATSGAEPRKSKKSAAAAPMPHDVRPMLATLVDKPFDRQGWIFETKWDGYRAIAEITDGKVRLYSRNQKSFDKRFAPVVESLKSLGHDALLDGEIVALDDGGQSHFQLLQNYQKTGRGNLVYCVFDLLYLDGKDLRPLPLLRRKEMLAKVLGKHPQVMLSEHVEGDGKAFFKAATAHGLEGIIAKDGASIYREGIRSHEWLKIKTHRRQEAVIAGYTEPRGSRKALGALVLGVYDHGNLTYVGHAGGGLDSSDLESMLARLRPLQQKSSPFTEPPATNAPVHWVKPVLVCEVKFQEWTSDGRMRQPIFVGMREDKPAREVHCEDSKPAAAVLDPAPEPKLTNLDKVYWPEDGYTKGDLIAYYKDVADVLLPHLRDRPMTLHRQPSGIADKGFFQKDVSRQPPPSWVRTAAIAPESGAADITYVVCQDEATLLYLANLGCIEMNPWLSRIDSLDRPDYLVIDLDPEEVGFAAVIKTALRVHKVLDKAGVPSCCKTSGKRGMHIGVPLGAAYSYEQARQFAEIVARVVNSAFPDSTSVVRSPRERQHRVYLDFLQNKVGATLALAYSVRPVPGAWVSTPLRWSEVKSTLDPSAFTIRTTRRRLDRVGDLWAPVLGPGINLEECLARMEKVRARSRE
jgi:bifunctional non-homologous end joining protein LigD